MNHSAYDIVQSNAYADGTLCAITISASHSILYFNNTNYVEDSFRDSDITEKLWNIISSPGCEQHPLTVSLKSEMSADNMKFDLPHLITHMRRNYQKLPGIRINEYKMNHKRTNVCFEIQLWLTIGQLKFLSSGDIDKMHIEVHSPVGKIEL